MCSAVAGEGWRGVSLTSVTGGQDRLPDESSMRTGPAAVQQEIISAIEWKILWAKVGRCIWRLPHFGRGAHCGGAFRFFLKNRLPVF
jgi:hypothetical protein